MHRGLISDNALYYLTQILVTAEDYLSMKSKTYSIKIAAIFRTEQSSCEGIAEICAGLAGLCEGHLKAE